MNDVSLFEFSDKVYCLPIHVSNRSLENARLARRQRATRGARSATDAHGSSVDGVWRVLCIGRVFSGRNRTDVVDVVSSAEGRFRMRRELRVENASKPAPVGRASVDAIAGTGHRDVLVDR